MTLGTRLAGRLAAAAVAALLLSGTASARPPKPPVCRDGRFVTPPGAAPLLAGANAATPEAVVIEGAAPTIAIVGRCPAVRVRLRGTKRGTKVVASWPKTACGPGKVRLTAMIDAACHAMQGMVRASRSSPIHFVAPRCGDGLIDRADAEVCDGAGCAAGQECSADCRCVELPPPPITPAPVSFGGEVQPIFSARCAVPSCHSGASPTQGLDLSPGRSYGAIVNRASTELPALKIIDPGAPATSYLDWKIEGAPPEQSILGSLMPLAGGPLSPAEQAIIRRWISEGALNDQPASTTSPTVTSTSTTSTTTTQPTLVSFRGEVQPIFTAQCAVPGCHSGPLPAQGLDLDDGSSYAAVVNQPSTEEPAVKLVDPGVPLTSYLLWKVGKAPDGESIMFSPMPLIGVPLSVAQVETIRAWVTEGALDN